MMDTNETTETKTKPRNSGSLFKRLVMWHIDKFRPAHIWFILAAWVSFFSEMNSSLAGYILVLVCALFYYLSSIMDSLAKIEERTNL